MKLNVNDSQNRRKHAKMKRRLMRGILLVGAENTGKPDTSKVHIRCQWYKNRLKRDQT